MKLDERIWPNIVLLCFTAGFIGFVGGAAFSDGSSSLREWIGALSGWFAGLIALYIGHVTLAPLLRDILFKERNEKRESALQLIEHRSKALDLGHKISKSLSVFSVSKPECLLVGDLTVSPVQARQNCFDTAQNALDLCTQFHEETARLEIAADTGPDLNSETVDITIMLCNVQDELIAFSEEILEKGYPITQSGTTDEFFALLADMRKREVFLKINKANTTFFKQLRPYVGAVTREGIRVKRDLFSN